MKDDDLIGVLEDAGLSPYQAEAYVTLLELGNASATDIADACDVPDPRIYDVLRDLEAKGYIETYQQDSLTARAHDPAEVLENLRSRSSEYLDAAEEIEDRWKKPAIADHEVSIVKRFDTVLNRSKELIGEAEHQIQVNVDAAQFRALHDGLAAARERGVDVKLSICTSGDAGVPDASELEGACVEARAVGIPTPFIVVIDGTWTCFAPHERSVNDYGVLVNDRSHAYIFYWFFLTGVWEIGDTIYTDRTDRVPRAYVDIRECVRDIEVPLEEGARIEATVEGNDTSTGERRELRGRIVDVDYDGAATADGRPLLAELAGRISVTLDTGERVYEIGGWDAVLEDVEARTIRIEAIDYE
ncbi:MAG: TrmB family transcriptional regulator [Haloarculaceae archaeon]